MAKTQIMGILNVTPDSFFPESRTLETNAAIDRALKLQDEGADILDIGGESTRPGSLPVEEKIELQRVIPIIKELTGRLSIPISIDTKKPAVAKAALDAGAHYINDVSGFSNPEMISIAKDYKAEICVMHMQGTPTTMQQNPYYNSGVIAHLITWFEQKVELLVKNGIQQEKIILDPGIGFGKTVADNLEIIHNLPLIKGLGFRVLLGISRKSFLAKICGQPTELLLPATIAINTVAISEKIDMIRVHDVKEHRIVVDAMEAYTQHNTHYAR